MSNSTTFFDAFPPVATDEWEARITKDLDGADYKKKLRWDTGEGLSVLPFYRQEDLQELETATPIINTVHHPWEARAHITGLTAADANTAVREALQSGADAVQLSVKASCYSTKEIRITGLPIQNQADFSTLTTGISLEQTPLHIDAGILSPGLLAMLWQEVRQQSLSADDITGTICYDPIANLLQSKQALKSDELSKSITEIASFTQQHLSNIRPLGVDARLYHHSGATIVQELAFALASATGYLAALTEHGLSVEEAADMLHFNVAIGSKYFLEISKIRALRLLWDNLLEAFHGNAEQTPAYIHAATSLYNKTVYDPYTNMLRTSTEGMSAVIGGCDALTILPFDELFQQPDNFSLRMARNSQTIMREEAYLHKVQDPSAGSYYIEQITHGLAREAWQLFQDIEEQGGMREAIEKGFVQSAIEQSRQQRDQDIATRHRVFVGTNQYPNTKRPPKKGKAAAQKRIALNTTGREFNITDPFSITELSDCFANGATLGDVIPQYISASKTDIQLLKPYRGPQAFETLRRATEQHDTTPTVLNLPIGDPQIRKARSSFSNNLFGCIGYHIEDPIGFEDTTEAIRAIEREQPEVAVLCSSDKAYKQLVPELCHKLNQASHRPLLVLAGYPKEQVDSYKQAGIDLFVYSGCNVLEILKEVQQKLNIIKNGQ
ncbi:methylmalonyl-CoA mutase family protein [Fodinibius salsisoli]|uniref:Methylmalonyl-CoA mutase small subunit n=1 Tax=Fodinibius salsisoli TaxID=2820877 RepID=A0ABT3PSD6_9BACT|nr:methylmalonyl-CoA mutase family protein [Fodinibius salsisoli]MCW9708766.1 methylmalonyl-CoA mutase small subunit [Fodinibius salsisoli]